jgi:polycomb protein EED
MAAVADDSSEGTGAAESVPPIPACYSENLWRRRPKFSFTTCVVEESKTPRAIYNISFCALGGNFNSIFATVGGNRATVYQLLPDGHIDVRQVYVDDDDKEDYYTSRWTFDDRTKSPILIAGGLKGTAKVINCKKQCLVNVLIGHGNSINEICVHPVDQNLVFTASKDESIRLWNVLNGLCIAIFSGDQGHRDEVLSMDVHLLGNCFASCGMDNTIKIWALDTEKVIEAVEESYEVKKKVLASSLPPDDDEEVSSVGSTSNATTAQGSPATAVDSTAALGGGGDDVAMEAAAAPPKTTAVFKTRFFQFPAYSTSKVHSDYVDCVRWMGDLIMSKSTGDKICLWKPNPLRKPDAVTVLREFVMHDAEIWFVRFDVDPMLEGLVCGNRSGKIFVWNIQDNDTVTVDPCTSLQHRECVGTVRHTVISPDRRTVLSCCDDGSIWRWDLAKSDAKKKRKFR